jgi:hypothetical protein
MPLTSYPALREPARSIPFTRLRKNNLSNTPSVAPTLCYQEIAVHYYAIYSHTRNRLQTAYKHGNLLLALALFTLSSNIPLLSPLLPLYISPSYKNLTIYIQTHYINHLKSLLILHRTTPIPPSLRLAFLISQHTKTTLPTIRKHTYSIPICSRTSHRSVQTMMLVYHYLNTTSTSLSSYTHMHGLLCNYYAYYQSNSPNRTAELLVMFNS